MTEMTKNFAPADWTCRRLSGEDASCYRTALLEALQAHPEAFVASAEDEALLSVDDFARRLDAKENAIFGVFAGNELAAIATFQRQPLRKQAHVGMISGMYVRSEQGRSGMGKNLLQYVLAFAEQHVDQVELHVNVANKRARKLYLGFGFESYGVRRRSLRVAGTDHDAEMLVKFFR
jgi:ribosomal protein S18 acetylase RimI-like enzyme